MERSVKFISLSGMSGVLAGIYAISGAILAYFIVHYPISPLNYRIYSITDTNTLWKLLAIAAFVLVASLGTGIWFSQRKAKRQNLTLWTVASRKLFTNLAIPLVTGGIFILALLYNGHYGVAAPACLIFYGLALIHASEITYNEIRYLGYTEIVLGLISSLLPGYGLIFWVIGFGLLHIIYGLIMHNKYDK
jgi:general stress protein CsbA